MGLVGKMTKLVQVCEGGGLGMRAFRTCRAAAAGPLTDHMFTAAIWEVSSGEAGLTEAGTART